jgi:uncharacterized protein YfaP (DUF2135 family)
VGEEVDMPDQRVTGVGLHGDEPKRLSLNDGSRLVLDPEAHCRAGGVRWKRVGWRRGDGSNDVSVAEARVLAGERYEHYVTTRTKSEAEWMRAVADWYREQADVLTAQLGSRG